MQSVHLMKISKNYKKIFSKYWGYADQDIPICWGCYRKLSVDIHHLTPKGFGGSKKNLRNTIDNLFPVCRDCHNLAHKNKQVNADFRKHLQEKIDNKEYEEHGE